MKWIEHSLFQTRSYQVEIPRLQLAAIRQLNKYLSERLEVEQVIYFILIVLAEKTKAGNGPISLDKILVLGYSSKHSFPNISDKEASLNLFFLPSDHMKFDEKT